MVHRLRARPGLTAVLIRSWRHCLGLALAGLVGSGLLASCAPGSAQPAPGTVPVTFVYVIDGPQAGVAHTTHLQILDPKNVLLSTTTLPTAGSVDTGTVWLKPGNYSAISWDEAVGSPGPIISTKCGSLFTIDPGQALVVTVTASRIGACLTDTLEPGASPSPSASPPAPSPLAGPS
jgi:hypothetical protein